MKRILAALVLVAGLGFGVVTATGVRADQPVLDPPSHQLVVMNGIVYQMPAGFASNEGYDMPTLALPLGFGGGSAQSCVTLVIPEGLGGGLRTC